MAEVRARKKLEEISLRFSNKIPADQIFNIFKNPQNKYSHEKLFNFLQNSIKPLIVDGDKLLAQYETNVKKNQKTSHEALIIMLNNATVAKQSPKPPIAEKPNLTKISVRSDNFESPTMSSTRYEPAAPEIVVSEVIKMY